MKWAQEHQSYLYTPANASTSFMYSLAEYFILQGKSETNPYYDSFISLNFTDVNIKGALVIEKFRKFEKLNDSISINVHSTEDELKHFYPVYCSENTANKKAHVINLLYSYEQKFPHYHLITDLSRLFSLKNIRGKGSCNRKLAQVCPRCYYRSYSIYAYSNHRDLCKMKHASEIELVHEPIKFEAIQKTSLAPLIGFYDMESRSVDVVCDKCVVDCRCNTKKLEEQLPISYSLYIINTLDDTIFYTKTYSGDNSHVNFLETLISLKDTLLTHLMKYEPMDFTEQDQTSFDNQTMCLSCNKPIEEGQGRRDHCHISGKYRTKCHNQCNLLKRKDLKVTFWCHNSTGYDSHFLLQGIKDVYSSFSDVRMLPKNTEKIREITLDNFFVFRDSLEFLSGSLDKLGKLLKSKGHTFKLIQQHPLVTSDNLELVTTKGVFPYGMVTTLQQLEETTEFPPISAFYNDLEDSPLDEAQYEFGKRVWSTFNFTNMRLFMEMYCQVDCLLLAEIFLSFRNLLYNKFNLDPVKYVSLPSYSYDLMLKQTGLVIEPITDMWTCISLLRTRSEAAYHSSETLDIPQFMEII